MKIALMCFSTARLVRTSDSAIAALLLPCGDLGEHLALARRQLRQRRAARRVTCARDERLDDLRVDHRSAAGDLVDGADELAAVVDALLQQVGAALGAGLEQRERVGGIVVLASTTTPISGASRAARRRRGCPRRCPSAACGCR